MKKWKDAVVGKIIYVRDPIDVWEWAEKEDHGPNELVEPVKFTAPYQKASISDVTSECVIITIIGGEFDGEEFYFYYNKSTPDELLTVGEFYTWAEDYEERVDDINIRTFFESITKSPNLYKRQGESNSEVISLLEDIKLFAEHKDREEPDNAWDPRLIQEAIDMILKGQE